MKNIIVFDQIYNRIIDTLKTSELASYKLSLWMVRDLMGRVRLLFPEKEADHPQIDEALRKFVQEMHRQLGAHAYEPNQTVLIVTDEDIQFLEEEGVIRRKVGEVNLHLVDRVLTGSRWATISSKASPLKALRFTLFSLKGGVGRSTSAAVLAHHLAQKRKRVLLLDLDLESPGLSSMVLSPEEHPEYGLVDWFVEDLVGQGDQLIPSMIGRPRWEQELPGEILITPAYGSNPGEYLAKLGRVYMNRPDNQNGKLTESWSGKLLRVLEALEAHVRPDVVLLDSRNGLHDIAASAVMDIHAQVLLFAFASEATWAGYRILFRHWQQYELVTQIRERLSLVAALVPEVDWENYLSLFTESAWKLFCECLYDEMPPGMAEEENWEPFSFDLTDENAPHHPMPIFWNRGLSALSSLRSLKEPALSAAYRSFLERFDQLLEMLQETNP